MPLRKIGIGKTPVVNEIHKPIVCQRSYFIKGKFDQFQRDIPLSGLVQVFRDLIGQMLSQSDAQIQQWKIRLLDLLQKSLNPTPKPSPLFGRGSFNLCERSIVDKYKGRLTCGSKQSDIYKI